MGEKNWIDRLIEETLAKRKAQRSALHDSVSDPFVELRAGLEQAVAEFNAKNPDPALGRLRCEVRDDSTFVVVRQVGLSDHLSQLTTILDRAAGCIRVLFDHANHVEQNDTMRFIPDIGGQMFLFCNREWVTVSRAIQIVFSTFVRTIPSHNVAWRRGGIRWPSAVRQGDRLYWTPHPNRDRGFSGFWIKVSGDIRLPPSGDVTGIIFCTR